MKGQMKFKVYSKYIFATLIVVFCIALIIIFSKIHTKELLTNFSNKTITNSRLEYSDGFYVGQLSGGKITGEGQYVLNSGSSYNGKWENNNPSGSGTLKIHDVGTYIGSFNCGKREGTGTLTWNNGDVYTGKWLDDRINGDGKITYANGSYLEGTFENNKLICGKYESKLDIGKITFTISTNGSDYALLKLNDGTEYDGTITNGSFNGNCKISYSNGDKYEGSIVSNLKSGYGTYKWVNGASYVGNWSNDNMNGNGIYYYTPSTNKKYLNGGFKDNKPTGTITYYDENLDKYTTTWSNGKCSSVKKG